MFEDYPSPGTLKYCKISGRNVSSNAPLAEEKDLMAVSTDPSGVNTENDFGEPFAETCLNLFKKIYLID